MLRARHAVILYSLALLCIGMVMVNSAVLSVEPGHAVTFQSILWSRPAFFMAAAMVSLLIASRLPIDRLFASRAFQGFAPLLLPIMLGLLMLVYMPGIGHEVNGAKRWIRAPGLGFTFQPSEIAKWGVLMLLAWHCARRVGQMHKVTTGLLPGLLIVGLVAGLIATEDLGTAVLIAGAGSMVLIAAGARLWHFALAIPVGLAGAAVAVITSPYRVQRLVSFIDPYADPQGSGYHMIQSLVAVANGEVWGRGLGFGLQKFGYLPEDETDFLFAIICEELGIAGAAAVIALYAGLLWTGLGIVRKQQNTLLKLLGMGIVCTVALQTLINLMVVTGLAPTKGIALPLLSSGGTGWILTAASLGLLVSMDRIADRAAARATLLIEPRNASLIPDPAPLEPYPAARDAAAA